MAQQDRGGRGRDRGPREEVDSEFVDKLVHINRVAKVVKGGRRFGFAALVVVGDQKGRVGFGHGKAREVPEAIRKATEEAKKTMIRVPLRENRTLHHDGNGRWGAGKIMVRAAPPGTGVIAPAISDTAAKSTSPTSPSSTRLIPTSTTTAPGLTISAVIKLALPIAATRTSAVRVTAGRSWVRL